MESPGFVVEGLLGVLAGVLVGGWEARRRDRRRHRWDRVETDLAWNRDLWATITGLGPLLSNHRADMIRPDDRPRAYASAEAVIRQASEDYQRALEVAIRRFPASTVDALMRVSLAWTTVELASAAMKITGDRSDQLDPDEAQRHIDAHREALGVLQILVTNKYHELIAP